MLNGCRLFVNSPFVMVTKTLHIILQIHSSDSLTEYTHVLPLRSTSPKFWIVLKVFYLVVLFAIGANLFTAPDHFKIACLYYGHAEFPANVIHEATSCVIAMLFKPAIPQHRFFALFVCIANVEFRANVNREATSCVTVMLCKPTIPQHRFSADLNFAAIRPNGTGETADNFDDEVTSNTSNSDLFQHICGEVSIDDMSIVYLLSFTYSDLARPETMNIDDIDGFSAVFKHMHTPTIVWLHFLSFGFTVFLL